MITHLLDTNICVYAIKKKHPALLNRLSEMPTQTIGISSITLAELEYGVYKSERVEENHAALREYLTPFIVSAWDADAAAYYGNLRCFLERNGKIIGPMDLLIAAQALALDVTLVTNNEREFRRVPGLRVENWIAAD